MIANFKNFIKSTFFAPRINTYSENRKVNILSKYFRDNQKMDKDFWEAIGYQQIIDQLIDFSASDVESLIKDFGHWNVEALWLLADMFGFIEKYDSNNKLSQINVTELYCIIFTYTNEADSKDLIGNLYYLLERNQNQSEATLNQVELKLRQLIKAQNSASLNKTYDEILAFIAKIKNRQPGIGKPKRT